MTQPDANPQSSFVVDLLITLRQDHFSVRGWGNFLKHSWLMSLATAKKNPALFRSWRRQTCLLGGVLCILLTILQYTEGTTHMLRCLLGLLFCYLWQQSDLFWHLGLHYDHEHEKIIQRIGIANNLTALRGIGAAFLLARLLGNVPIPMLLAFSVYSAGILTDVLDGPIARATHMQSKLGTLLDGETDFCLSLVLTIALVQNGILPLWLAVIFIARFGIPIAIALGSYFLFTQPVHLGSTLWGKCTGIAQCCYLLIILAPLPPIFQQLHLPLLILTIVLLIGAPIAQIKATMDTRTERAGHISQGDRHI